MTIKFCSTCSTQLAHSTQGNKCDPCIRASRGSMTHHINDRNPAWMQADDRKCDPSTQHLFFAPEGETRRLRVVRERAAFALCAFCAHRSPCKAYARTYRLQGIWGGETDLQRAQAGFGAWGLANAADQARRAYNRNKQETA